MKRTIFAISGILVISLFVISISTNAENGETLFQEQQDTPAPPPDPEQPFQGRCLEHFQIMKEKIGLTDEQIEKLDALRFAHQKAMVEQTAKLKVAYMELAELMKTKGNDNAVKQKSREISALRNQFMDTNIDHRLAVRNIFTDEQWEKLSKFVGCMGCGPGHGMFMHHQYRGHPGTDQRFPGHRGPGMMDRGRYFDWNDRPSTL